MEKSIHMISVKSKNILSIGYDSNSKRLRIQFKSGGLYEYKNVPENIFKNLFIATSKGKYFYNNIRDKHQSMKIKTQSHNLIDIYTRINNTFINTYSEILEDKTEEIRCSICGEIMEKTICKKCSIEENNVSKEKKDSKGVF